jgi:uncharacterized OB-fold protein
VSEASELVDERLFEWDGELAPGAPIALVASRCDGCGRCEFPRLEHCPECGGPASPVRLSRSARVSQWTAVNHATPGGLVDVPYSVAVADFPEGISILGLVRGDGSPGEVALGDEVTVVATEVGDKLGYAFAVVAS